MLETDFKSSPPGISRNAYGNALALHGQLAILGAIGSEESGTWETTRELDEKGRTGMDGKGTVGHRNIGNGTEQT